MRQSTEGSDDYAEAIISKLPMRQSTEATFGRSGSLLSKLPMRQSTHNQKIFKG